MKKLFCLLLCLCLMLNGAASLALAEEAEAAEEVVHEEKREEEPVREEKREEEPVREEKREEEPVREEKREEEPVREEKREEEPVREEEPSIEQEEEPVREEVKEEEPSEEPSQEEEPSDEPSQEEEPSEEPSQEEEPSEEPSQEEESSEEPSQEEEPSEEPSQEEETPSDEPAEEQPGEETEPVEGEEVPDPLEEEEPAEEEPVIPDDAQAWLTIDGVPFGGALSDIINILEGGETVYLRTDRTIHVADVPLSIVAEVSFRPDRDVFHSGKVVRLYNADPSDGGGLWDFSGVSGWELGDVWFRVEDEEREPDDGGEEQEPDERPAIGVTPSAFVPGEWVNEAPVFELTGIPEGKDWMYAVIVFGNRIIPLLGNTYRPGEDGVYTLQFVIQDELGDIVSASSKISVWFDWTKPRATIENAKTENYTLNVTATDGMSGVVALSFDGGKNWQDALDGATYSYTAKSKATLPAGQIRVMDAAGNVYASDKAYTLAAVTSAASGAKSSSSSSSSSTSSGGTDSHATDTGDDEAPTDELKLKLPDEPMRRLTIDGESMALTLTLESEGREQGIRFTGSFQKWYDANGRLTEKPNLLVLEAGLDDVGDVFNCRWDINGEVIKRLSNAGIDYLAFRALDDVCVVSTAGFIGGTKYTELKMNGVSTKAFDYALTMKVNRDVNVLTALTENDLAEDCDFTLRVDVEDMGYELSASPKSPIYYYDVYLGPEDMLAWPFGQYMG